VLTCDRQGLRRTCEVKLTQHNSRRREDYARSRIARDVAAPPAHKSATADADDAGQAAAACEHSPSRVRDASPQSYASGMFIEPATDAAAEGEGSGHGNTSAMPLATETDHAEGSDAWFDDLLQVRGARGISFDFRLPEHAKIRAHLCRTCSCCQSPPPRAHSRSRRWM
jgi:hypothetical protein